MTCLAPGSPGKQRWENRNPGLLAPSPRSFVHFQSGGDRVAGTGAVSEPGGKRNLAGGKKAEAAVRRPRTVGLFKERRSGRGEALVHGKGLEGWVTAGVAVGAEAQGKR